MLTFLDDTSLKVKTEDAAANSEKDEIKAPG